MIRAKPRKSPWKVSATASYVYVTVRPAREVRSLFDFSRPFHVEDNIGLDDAALVRLVDYIRSSPSWTSLPEGLGPRTVNGALPISHVRRTPQGVEVTLLRDNASGEIVTLAQQNQQWAIVKISMWIA